VVVNYNQSERQASELLNIIKKIGGEAILVKADVSDPDQVERLVKLAMESYGSIDILVNNAGLLIPETFLEAKLETWDKTIETNLKSAYMCAKAVAPIMLEQKHGRIINMSSVSGLAHKTALKYVHYSVSKAGMIGLTRSLAVNLAPYVNVNAICPGIIDTEIVSYYTPETRKFMSDDTLLGRFGRPEEVASLALFLASDESDYITGESFTIAGGRAMR
jgi:3-oxoacyl-[acyl-carrier protein] reductase